MLAGQDQTVELGTQAIRRQNLSFIRQELESAPITLDELGCVRCVGPGEYCERYLLICDDRWQTASYFLCPTIDVAEAAGVRELAQDRALIPLWVVDLDTRDMHYVSLKATPDGVKPEVAVQLALPGMRVAHLRDIVEHERRTSEELQDRYNELDAVLNGERDCPTYVLVADDGWDRCCISLHDDLSSAAAIVERQFRDVYPWRAGTAINLESGRRHTFDITATAEPPEETWD
jgi:hypothetical protein